MLMKPTSTAREAVSEIPDGATVLVSGFGGAGTPVELLHALIDHGARDLTLVNNNVGNGYVGLAAVIATGRVRKMICSFPRSADPRAFRAQYTAGRIELELVPQGTLAERLRAGGSGVPAFYTRAGVGTELAAGKESREFDGRTYILEKALRGDFALVKALRADTAGNLIFNKAARNFGPVMCMAATRTIVQVSEVVEAGMLDPEHIVTPGIFVDHLVEVAQPIQEEILVQRGVVYP